MKFSMWAVLALCLPLSNLVLAQSAGGEIPYAIQNMEVQMTAALLKGDQAASEKYLARNYVRIYPDGTVAPTDDLRNAMKFTALEVSGQQLHVTGETAVSVFKSKVKATANGQPVDGNYLNVRTWAKEQGEWKAVSLSSIRLSGDADGDSSQPAATSHEPAKERAHVKENIYSDDLAKLTLTLDPTLKYLGSIPFDIRGIAGGYRYIWGETDHGNHLRRTFIVQAEGYYPGNQGQYNYGAPDPLALAGKIYQHNVWIYDNDQSARENPGNESDLTRTFFREHGYEWEPQLVMSRFARVVDESKKNEIIFFYFENLADYTKKSVADFPDGGKDPEQQRIQQAVDTNSRKALDVVH